MFANMKRRDLRVFVLSKGSTCIFEMWDQRQPWRGWLNQFVVLKAFFLLCFQSIQLTHDFLENIVCRITYHLAIKLILVKGLTLNQNLEFKGKAIIYLQRHMLANVMFTRSPKKSKTYIQTLTLLFSEYPSIWDHSSNDE